MSRASFEKAEVQLFDEKVFSKFQNSRPAICVAENAESLSLLQDPCFQLALKLCNGLVVRDCWSYSCRCGRAEQISKKLKVNSLHDLGSSCFWKNRVITCLETFAVVPSVSGGWFILFAIFWKCAWDYNEYLVPVESAEGKKKDFLVEK